MYTSGKLRELASLLLVPDTFSCHITLLSEVAAVTFPLSYAIMVVIRPGKIIFKKEVFIKHFENVISVTQNVRGERKNAPTGR